MTAVDDRRFVAAMAGLAYVLAVFVVGFVLGSARGVAVLMIPGLSPLVLVLAELPIILAVSWIVCGWTIRRWRVPPSRASRANMGLVAFALLMLAEFLLARALFGRDLVTHLSFYTHVEHALGLAGQVVFGLFPMLRD